ncbi:hypothetical protein ACFOOK_16355 [Micromonospora krabiensis]|uniref:Uncharacterized protein n=1 Tax=Micromonospora krabiensis TaxID=307121 RepID=A0A1C3N066_9ACTN|nr:hypothetical protein [Micromonospora krabiensis]SBV25983.1 hypothetical protein GA0070620_1465 [Micromonospora krabiensis]
MGEVLPIPSFGDLFADVRGEDRMMRVSYHPDRGAVVLSLWSGPVCRGSFRLATGDVPRLLALLTETTGAAPTAGAPPTAAVPDRTDPRSPVVRRAAVPRPAGGSDAQEGAAHRRRLPIVPLPRIA